MGKKSSSYQAIDPNVGKAMKRQADLAEAQQQWYETEMQPWLMHQTEQQNEWAERDRQFARDQALWWRDYTRQNTAKLNERADEQYNRWKATLGSENAMVDNARNFNVGAEQERQTESALTDITAGNAVQRKALGQQLTTQGIDPTSGQYQAQFRQLGDAEANTRAQAILAAEKVAKELGWNKKMQAVGIGQGYMNQSLQYANNANSIAANGAQASLGANGQASSFGQLGLSNISNLYNNRQSYYGNLMNTNNSMFNLGMGTSNTNLNAAVANNQNQQQVSSAWGNALGSIAGATASYYANGGFGTNKIGSKT